MGYETEVGPIPTRREEEKLIRDIKESFQNQSYTNYNIPESNRLTKERNKELKRSYNVVWFRNFARGLFFSGIVLVPFTLALKRGPFGVPTFNVSRTYFKKSFNSQDYNTRINIKAAKYVLPTWLTLGTIYAYQATSNESFFDEEMLTSARIVLPSDVARP